MAQQLPSTATEQRIWHLCQRLEFFANHVPLALQKLAASSTNDNYYVHTQRGHYLVRHYKPGVAGVCRQQELRCQHAAAAAGVAPAPLCLNNHQRILISDFLTHSRHFDWELHHTHLLQLVEKLVRLHKLKVQTPVLDPFVYLQQLRDKVFDAAWSADDEQDWQRLRTAASAFSLLPGDQVLCHMDLHSGNILLQHQQLWLIDYEYCQQADSAFDLAALCLNLQLNTKEQEQLLNLYLQFRPQARQDIAQRLQLASLLYSGFCWLWYKSLEGGADKAKLAQLTLRQFPCQHSDAAKTLS
ncbi:phosphotransferase [Rheinheimera tilapiae]|uniref:Phosphotransferase n=1 Tax=Rheinheimera tilapiae TaxID=875043 RepID=A0ABV6BGV2_9GAMM